ncbi:hypothetical protein FG93_01542 [Bosea sp. LC85]|uniref:hypothetical protein n=1 Tax=Bosea sp. LC85 TaxID=1502851 RepID=UPI0004E2D8F5|nr:hypothetical protein [Bosea sp. LC85]KFC73852.1 hypothetical protein FG93_01542 [Bosea sp. LC85]
MIRVLAIAVIATVLLPAGAEAAKFRGGSRSSHGSSEASSGGGSGSSLVVTPRIGRSSQQEAAKGDALPRAPFPTANAAAPAMLRLSTAEEPRVWCRSEVVVGGFCMLN